MILAIVITSFLLGGVWVYLVPTLQAMVPSNWASNKIAQVAVTGGFLLLTVFIVSVIVKSVGVKSVG